MSTATIILEKKLREYLLNVSVKESEILRELREETAQMEYSAMQISPEQGAFMSFLVELIQAKRTLEIGVFTGYSAQKLYFDQVPHTNRWSSRITGHQMEKRVLS